MTGDDGSLADFKIAILGLGLMGGSLALALKGHCAAIYGVDTQAEIVSRATEQGIVDLASDDPEQILPLADVVILAVPVSMILNYLYVLPAIHPGSALVVDIGSSKAEIVQAMNALPPRFDPVGGHPMCGKEVSGLANADPDLFRVATFAFTPLERTSRKARKFCDNLARTIGAEPLWVDAASHDHWTAETSHFPYLLANSLASVTSLEAAPLVGPGFRSSARLAASSQQMMRDILATNRENVLLSIAGFKQHLEQIETLLMNRDLDTLETLLEDGAKRYEALITKQV